MESDIDLDRDHDVFSAKRTEDIIIFRFKQNLLLRTTDLRAMSAILNYLNLVSENNSIKVLVIFGSPRETSFKEIVQFHRQVLETSLDEGTITRMYNAIDQFILRIAELNKIVIHADTRKSISLSLNVSLACDYRIVSDNTVFKNFHLDLGLAPKGGSAFFLTKMIGLGRAYKILLSEEEITAQEALRFGIVDKVVALSDLEEGALKTAQHFAQKPAGALSGVKRLLNYSMRDLKDYLEFENEALFRIIMSNEFQKRLGEYTESKP
jgi:2-(1,2-epoxy-1,2-dihydrophenyl)acetyl-CoA isomerase